MASVRITNDIKTCVVHDLLVRAFGDRDAALEAKKLRLADLVYWSIYDKKEIEALKKVAEEFLNTDKGHLVKFGGEFRRVNWGEDRIVSNGRRGTLILGGDHPLTDLHREIKAEDEKLKDSKHAARLEARAKLDSVTTLGRLIEVWPEIRPFVERYLEPKKKQLPVLRNEELNKTFNLPVETKKEGITKKPKPVPKVARKKALEAVKTVHFRNSRKARR